MKSLRLAVLLLSIAIITPVFAATPDIRDWENSPQGYFMTKAEQQEWSAIKTQEDAQHFIDQFLARRGPGFAADVATRAEKADKYLSLGKHPGSKSLRGKLVILLGPPSAPLDTYETVDNSGVHHDSPLMASAYSGGSRSGGVADGGGDSASNEGARTMGGSSIVKNFHLVYANAPGGAIDVTIQADPNTGKDRPKDKNSAKQLDAVFEAAAQASIKVK